ncbi:Bifunctional purine biosynthesis protein PURH [Hondaea fermentalgiana]|uniref:Bifunctional purine biosynthesis protein PURH n=1 Tax=Hondaea fermentalgiana TaxID=2315210 RepID=A0A2R5GRW3_9STRA|nr:Bifunctional purine biosynthesis protein PURH [Hondaea fermentalgiana]|eukprot:GBG31081.1 Bifunctional purine biosynthesis protein PURH [Hondaea fermentalgiana]
MSGASSHMAIKGSTEDKIKLKRALLSVSDKTDLVELGKLLATMGVELLSTGGTAKALRDAGLEVKDVAEVTGSPEMLDGRVKTLHPKIHGGILAVRGNEKHAKDMEDNGIGAIDLVVLNLYPFEKTVANGFDFATCVENVDIGGPAMLRAAAKNHSSVAIVTDPSQYEQLLQDLVDNGGCTSMALRKSLAAAAFALTAAYDGAIATYFAKEVKTKTPDVTRTYAIERPLKYGCNPNQVPAALCQIKGTEMPFEVLNGNPGYINLLDASNAWQLVRELRTALNKPAAASFKHVSPAGAAVAVPLTDVEFKAYEMENRKLNLTNSALAYLRARQADPMSSFGDFAALSDVVDKDTALVLKTEVSDGIVAPGYSEEALEILKAKKKGGFIVLKANPYFEPPPNEYREVFGQGFMQRRNDVQISPKSLEKVVTTKATSIPADAQRDLTIASIALKYTQSNSVGYAKNGQMIGVGAGQQSRVDCVKLAGRKVQIWYLRQHPKVLALNFKEGVKRQDRINARVRYIEGDFTDLERKHWETLFDEVPAPLTQEDKDEFMASLSGVANSSDAFYPFRDNIDVLSRYGVQYIAQPGGSVKDDEIVEACDQYGIAMAFTGDRLFHH